MSSPPLSEGNSVPKYEPFLRLGHIAGRVGRKAIVHGGWKGESLPRSLPSSPVVEIFDQYSELWEQRQVVGITPFPETYFGASASLGESLFTFGGVDQFKYLPRIPNYFNDVYRLDTSTWCWSRLSPKNCDSVPMPKCSSGMIAFGNSLVVLGGYGILSCQQKSDQLFIKNPECNDERGWTNELHIFNISEGIWTCPATTGERPPPSAGHSFTIVDHRRAVMFGGRNEEHDFMNDVYILDLFTMNWKKIDKLGDAPWPEERNFHAACCLNYGQKFPHLLVTGGRDKKRQPLGDIWLLDIERKNWRMMEKALKACSYHTLTAFSLGPGVTECMQFGGKLHRTDTTILGGTTLLLFRLVECSVQSQWQLISLDNNVQLGTQLRSRSSKEVNMVKRCAMLYYTNIRFCSFRLQVYVAPQNGQYAEEIHREVKRKHCQFEGGPISMFEFDDINPIINLDLPKDPVSGWTMKLLNTDQIGQHVISFQVSISWVGAEAEQLRKLEEKLVLVAGSKTFKLMMYSPNRCSVPLSDEKAQKIIEKAFELSSFELRNVVCVITGLMGSGKTWLLSRLFKQIPPHQYTSTGIAMQSLRGLLHHIINVSFTSWEQFTHQQIFEFLASLFYDLLPEMFSITDEAIFVPTQAAVASLAPLPFSSTIKRPSDSTVSFEETPDYSPGTESSTMQCMMDMVKAPKGPSTQEKLELVHMVDTGGQPELLETLPSLIQHSHLAILVLNLMFGLDEHPSIDYHEEGKAYKREIPSQYSNRQIIQKLASTLQAKRFSQNDEQCCCILVVATHRDCIPEDELEDRVKAFDTALRVILLPSSNEELICFSANQILFVLNLKNPENEDMVQLDLIRSKISESKAGELLKIPGSFLVFEQLLMEFAEKEVKRDILHLSECVLIGEKLKMNAEEVEAALIFFHRQFTLLYFHQVLPNLVFMRPQIPLDCINSIVRFSYKVGSGEIMGITDKLVSSLRDGIITEEILSHKQLTQCFIPGLYEPQHAINYLCHTFTLAPLIRDMTSGITPANIQSTPTVKREKKPYLMMSLRPNIADNDVQKHLAPSEIASLVVQFTNNCVPLGCFSKTISCLMTIYEWKLSRADNGSPQCLAHNAVSLYTPQAPGHIVLIDIGHSIQIHINIEKGIEPHNYSQLCFLVKETVFAAIKQVFELLNLTKITAIPMFFCPCHIEPHHTASAYMFQSQWFLRCSIAENNVGAAQSKHKVWLNTSIMEGSKPSLPKLLGLKIPQKVGSNFMQFGILLLNDEDCTLTDAIRNECHMKCEEIVRRILVEWVRGRGRAVTWKTLTDTLQQCDLATLADYIDTTYK